MSGQYYLQLNEHARRFCADAEAGPLPLTNLRLELRTNYTNKLAVEHSRFCRNVQPWPWWQSICRPEAVPKGRMQLLKVSFYVPGRYPAAKMYAFSAEEMDARAARLAALPSRAAGDDLRAVSNAHGVAFFRPGRPPFAARCHRPSRTDARSRLYCVAGARLGGQVSMVYEFETTEGDFPAASREAEAAGAAILNNFARPEISRQPHRTSR